MKALLIHFNREKKYLAKWEVEELGEAMYVSHVPEIFRDGDLGEKLELLKERMHTYAYEGDFVDWFVVLAREDAYKAPVIGAVLKRIMTDRIRVKQVGRNRDRSFKSFLENSLKEDDDES